MYVGISIFPKMQACFFHLENPKAYKAMKLASHYYVRLVQYLRKDIYPGCEDKCLH